MQVAVVTRAAALSVGPRHWCKLGDGGGALRTSRQREQPQVP